RVAGALAEAVDRDLHLARAGLDGGEGVRGREAQVVVAVDADRRRVADEVDDPPDERPELARDRVADGVRDVDGRRPGVDDRLVNLEQVVDVRAGRVLGRELDLGVRPQMLAAVTDPADRLGQRLVAREAKLVLEVDVARGDEHVEVRPLGHGDRLAGPLRVAVSAPAMAAAARCGSPSRRRARAAPASPPGVSWAIRRTASKSPGEAAGKP